MLPPGQQTNRYWPQIYADKRGSDPKTYQANGFVLIRVYPRKSAANFFRREKIRLELQHRVELQAKRRTIQRARRRRDKWAQQSVGALGNNAG